MCWTYVLWSHKLRKRYTGSTTKTPEERLEEHNHRKSRFTSSGVPWVMLYKEGYSTFREARERERFLKSGAGRKWLDDHLPQPLEDFN